MKKYALGVSALFFLAVAYNCHSMTTVNRLRQPTSNTFGRRGYGLWSSREAEQAVQAAKIKRANEAIAEQDKELDEYFKKKPYLLNSDVLNRKSLSLNTLEPNAVSLADKTDMSWFDRIKNALYSMFGSGPSRKVEQAIQEDNTKRFDAWWEQQKKE